MTEVTQTVPIPTQDSPAALDHSLFKGEGLPAFTTCRKAVATPRALLEGCGTSPRRCLKVSTGVWLIAWVGITLLMPLAAVAGIPEPDLVWYGRITTLSGSQVIRVTSGTLTWRIEPPAGGVSWTVSTQLTNVNDQFSFILRVPCETPEAGVPATPETIAFTTPTTTYQRLNVTLDGQPLTLNAAAHQFSPTFADRGRAEQLNLSLGNVPADTDGDGLGDAWETEHFGNLGALPHLDPDGDGMSNLKEYRAGTDPQDPRSLFELVEVSRLPAGMQLRWSSQATRTYRVRRSDTLLALPSSYQIIQTGLSATPPLNEFLDTTAASGTQFFYLIQLEE